MNKLLLFLAASTLTVVSVTAATVTPLLKFIVTKMLLKIIRFLLRFRKINK